MVGTTRRAIVGFKFEIEIVDVVVFAGLLGVPLSGASTYRVDCCPSLASLVVVALRIRVSVSRSQALEV